MDQDAKHLQLLSIFHYIVGGLTGLCGCFPIIHLTVGIGVVSGVLNGKGPNPPPEFIGWFFILIAGTMIISMWSLAICMLVAGYKLNAHTGWMFCLIVAGLECLLTPYGTVLGVFTIVVLLRPSVKQLFGLPLR